MFAICHMSHSITFARAGFLDGSSVPVFSDR